MISRMLKQREKYWELWPLCSPMCLGMAPFCGSAIELQPWELSIMVKRIEHFPMWCSFTNIEAPKLDYRKNKLICVCIFACLRIVDWNGKYQTSKKQGIELGMKLLYAGQQLLHCSGRSTRIWAKMKNFSDRQHLEAHARFQFCRTAWYVESEFTITRSALHIRIHRSRRRKSHVGKSLFFHYRYVQNAHN